MLFDIKKLDKQQNNETYCETYNTRRKIFIQKHKLYIR